MNQLQAFIENGKAPVPTQAQAVATPEAAAAIPEEEPEPLTRQQSAMLMGLFKAFIADGDRDGARELTNGLMKFGRHAQSEFDKLRQKT